MSLDIYLSSVQLTGVFEANVTHNLGKMAREAGVYDCLWNGEGKRAAELIEPLQKAITDMQNRPEHYKQFDASNGWGTCEQFIPWLQKLLNACMEYPDSEISISK